MRKMLGTLATAGLLVFGAGAVSAQGVNVQIGVGEPGVRVMRDRRGPIVERRVIERRVVRPRGRLVCRTVVRERVRPSGVVLRRPTEVCRRVYR
jgi:hypothetical protein